MIRLTASDDELSTTEDWRIEVVEEWESRLLPGLGYSTMFPVDSETFGVLHGPSLELALVAWIHRNENRGPSHGRLCVGPRRAGAGAA
ncbi:MAG: hypothetical protein ACOZIN_09865 [Myxococcota bacterium]